MIALVHFVYAMWYRFERVFCSTFCHLQRIVSQRWYRQLTPYFVKCILLTNTVDSRYLAPVGSQNSRARVKWFSRYLALSREGHDSRIQDHRPTLPGVYNSQSMLSDNRGTYVSRISTQIDIAPATKSQQATLDFNNYATKLSNHTLCKATHDGVCVEISQTTSRLDRKQKWHHACAVGPAWSRFTKVGGVSRWQIRESHFK